MRERTPAHALWNLTYVEMLHAVGRAALVAPSCHWRGVIWLRRMGRPIGSRRIWPPHALGLTLCTSCAYVTLAPLPAARWSRLLVAEFVLGCRCDAPSFTLARRVRVRPGECRAEQAHQQQSHIYQAGMQAGMRQVQESERSQALQHVAQQQAAAAAEHKRQTADLLAEFEGQHRRAPLRDVPCGDERLELVECLSKYGDALKCADIMASFEACATGVREGLMKPMTSK